MILSLEKKNNRGLILCAWRDDKFALLMEGRSNLFEPGEFGVKEDFIDDSKSALRDMNWVLSIAEQIQTAVSPAE